jgi:HPt (histidine-containing phosphotransfer) domain-containing protein
LTANAIVGNEEMFLAHGFQAFLSKPIDIMAMDVVIRQWVRNKDIESQTDPKGEAVPKASPHSSEISLYSADHPKEWVIPLIPAIEVPGINTEKGLERFGGDLNIYWDVVKSFARNTPPLLNEIRGSTFSAKEINGYAIIVHGIKSSSRSIGAEALGAKAEALEHAAKAGDLDFVRENHSVFIQAADQLLEGINAEISRVEAENQKPRKTEPATEILEDLVQACREFDIDGVDRAMEELESCEYETGADLVAWLREKVDGMGLKEIAGRLA